MDRIVLLWLIKNKNHFYGRLLLKNNFIRFPKIIYKNTVSSTNVVAKEILKSCNANFILISSEQISGKGRDLKRFYSPKDVGIYMTLVLRNFKRTMPIISKITALTVLKSIKKIAEDVYIKEPNDILLGNKKVCGILIESSLSAKEKIFDYVIIGIGVNVNNESFPHEIQDIATSIKHETGKKIEKNNLIENIILEFNLLLEIPENQIEKEYSQNLLKR